MDVVSLGAVNNQDFQLTLGAAQWISAGFDLSAASTIRMVAVAAIGDPIVLSFSNQPRPGEGAIALAVDPTAGTRTALLFTMPATLVETRVPSAITLLYDVRLTTADGRVRTLFGGTLTFTQGITNDAD